MVLVSILVFLLLKIAPGDPALIMAGPGAGDKAINAIKKRLGLDEPLHIQYFTLMKKTFTGTLRSPTYHRPVGKLLTKRLKNTVELGLVAFIITIFISIPAGIISATWQDSLLDYSVTFFALLGVSTPVFWTALMLMMFLSVFLGILPVSGQGAKVFGWSILTVDGLRHMVIPAIALSSVQLATNTRLTRSSMLEVLREDYITTARSKGIKERIVITRHAFKNALMPVLTNLGFQLRYLFAGAILTETTTAWPGVARLLYSAITRRDIPLVFALTLFTGVLFLLILLFVDLMYAYIDPRIKYD